MLDALERSIETSRPCTQKGIRLLVEAAVAVDGSTPVGCASLGLDGALQAVADVVHIAARVVVCETVLGACVLRAENCALENSLEGSYFCSGPMYKGLSQG